MSLQPEKIPTWERAQAEARAVQLLDPYGQTSEEFEAYRGTIAQPDENNIRAIRVKEFASEPRVAAAMETAIEAYSKAVAAVSEWLLAQDFVDKTIYRIQDEEERKGEIIEFLSAQGYVLAPNVNFTFTYPGES